MLLGFYFIENAKIRYDWGLILLKMVKQDMTKVWVGS